MSDEGEEGRKGGKTDRQAETQALIIGVSGQGSKQGDRGGSQRCTYVCTYT